MGILVTGGAGYIGSVTVERLINQGQRVVVFDNISTGHREAVHPGATFVEGDIHDLSAVEQALRDHTVDTVMHFAAYIQVGESVKDPRKYFENNVFGAHSVIAAALNCAVKQFILSSTAAVYGEPVRNGALDETHPTVPVNPYGLSKLMIEQMLEWYSSAYGLRYVALRYFNACGASETYGEAHEPESHLIPLILRAAKDPEMPITVFGTDYDTPDGTCIRDYVHVLDIAEAHLLARDYLAKGGESTAVNLGTSSGTSVLEVIKAVEEVSGRKPKIIYGASRPGDASRLVASSEKASRLLGWKASRSDIRLVVDDAWRWYLAHPNGYAR